VPKKIKHRLSQFFINRRGAQISNPLPKNRLMEKKHLFDKVMVIDDSSADRFIAAAVIKNSSFAAEVAGCESVPAALNYLQSLTESGEPFPRLIFLDLNMPGKDGYDFLEDFKFLPQGPRQNTTIVMLSATDSYEEIARMQAHPLVSVFLKKPLTDDSLKEVEEFLELKAV